MKKIIIGIIAASLLVILALGIQYMLLMHNYKMHNASILLPKKVDKVFAIALFEPAVHPAMDEISQGFMNTLEKSNNAMYQFKRYNANGNKTLMRAQAEEIVQGNFDLIFTIGAGCSQIIKEVASKKNKLVPQIFCAVDDPVGMGLIESLQNSGNQLTGIVDITDYTQQINLLLAVKPTIKTVLLVYDPTHGSGNLVSDKQTLTNLLQAKNITLNAVEVFNGNEIAQKVEALLPKNDVVLVLPDHTVVSAIDSLVRLCNRYGVTLYASDLNSGQKGAALTYGVLQKDYGIESAQRALAILYEGKKPSEIPTTAIKNNYFQINRDTMLQQKLIIEKSLFDLLQTTIFFPKQKEVSC